MITYEYPLVERIRTMLRLEDLFERARFYLERTEATDVIGRSGAPKHGGNFAVAVTPDRADLTIAAGRFYVQGVLCELDAAAFEIASFPSGNKATLAEWPDDDSRLPLDEKRFGSSSAKSATDGQLGDLDKAMVSTWAPGPLTSTWLKEIDQTLRPNPTKPDSAPKEQEELAALLAALTSLRDLLGPAGASDLAAEAVLGVISSSPSS